MKKTNELPFRRITHQLNYNPLTGGEDPYGDSETIPGQAMDVKSLLLRQQRNQEVPQFQGIFDDENELPDFRKMDFVERDKYREEIRLNIEDLENRHRALSAEQERLYMLELEQKQKQLQNTNPNGLE